MLNDVVLAYHVNPFGCGVARFGQQLAQRLGVPFRVYGSKAERPLINVKFAELGPFVPDPAFYYSTYDLFLHDTPSSPQQAAWIRMADTVYAGDPTIADFVAPLRKGVIPLWCPPTIQGNSDRSGGRILMFGMSHKAQRGYYERLKSLLDALQCGYTVSLSAWVHEGRVWDDEFQRMQMAAKDIFGDHLRMLGHLSDDALVREMDQSDYCALFFDPAARANNTTLWAALERCTVITNLDSESPSELIHDETVYDIHKITDAYVLTPLYGDNVARRYGWDQFMAAYQGASCEA